MFTISIEQSAEVLRQLSLNTKQEPLMLAGSRRTANIYIYMKRGIAPNKERMNIISAHTKEDTSGPEVRAEKDEGRTWGGSCMLQPYPTYKE